MGEQVKNHRMLNIEVGESRTTEGEEDPSLEDLTLEEDDMAKLSVCENTHITETVSCFI